MATSRKIRPFCAPSRVEQRQTKITQLPRSRSKLSTEEAALLREMFHDILAAHHEQVWQPPAEAAGV